MSHRTARALTARLASIAGIRQIHLLNRADAIADDVDRLFARTWRQVLGTLRTSNAYDAMHRSRELFSALYPALAQLLIDKFARLSHWSHATSARMLSRSLPLDYLQAATPLPADVALGVERGLLEDFTRDPSGLLQLGIGQATGLSYRDLTAPLREPATSGLSDEEARKLFEQLLFPPLPQNKIQRFLFEPGWVERMETLSKLAAPDVLSNIVMNGIAQGQTQAEIAQALLPSLNGVRASARRVARTAALDVAHQSQMEAFDGLGDLLAGYQIHAQLDQHTRPRHALRNGTTYWKDPEPGQLGFDVMPQPPKEADGSYAPNCRCHLTPVLRQPAKLRGKTPSYATAAGRIVPDPAVYSEWFARASPALRRKAVGVKRYEHVAGELGGTPRWADFLHPETGELLHLDSLKQESARERQERRHAVETGIAHRRELIVQALNRGYLTQDQDRISKFSNSYTSI